ncbi:hypothetical protein [Methylocystis heyeri]|uniref:Uncharacterized protein n=1 Tax=Methylocystis heyeri TaxID=391905 RepID=A0A6B8KCT7_9HYPH|nr:hypothetical protein [Methylocystis heyeri]QGM45497.1 hypothetical protein H2LOC_007190 [Methylocystis heyeri]
MPFARLRPEVTLKNSFVYAPQYASLYRLARVPRMESFERSVFAPTKKSERIPRSRQQDIVLQRRDGEPLREVLGATEVLMTTPAQQ